MGILGIIIVVLIVIVAIAVAVLYNKFVTLRTRSEEAWSDIDVQLKRRYDLIPNLIETVKGYAEHEKEVFQKVTEARTQAMAAEGLEAQAGAENMLTGALKSLFAVSENYPDLKANENFLELQRELTDTENKIQAARRFYNTNVRELNIAVESFPSNIIAKWFSFAKKDFFELDEAEQEAASQPAKVDF